jgi:hypothetical protein
VNKANGATVEELSQGIRNGQVGVSTVDDVRAAGGDVTPSPTANNPNHLRRNVSESSRAIYTNDSEPEQVKRTGANRKVCARLSWWVRQRRFITK